mmetsp:Transcript_18098/g.25767  ORF Transcript_18098/g.25767 Transcript_18098/m.25767 type:complete len:351 (-) Transcript_18098:115-1167(-)
MGTSRSKCGLYNHKVVVSLLACILLTNCFQVSCFSKHSTAKKFRKERAIFTRLHAANDDKKRVSILFCPAQFCVPADYDEMLSDIQDHFENSLHVEIGTCRVASLPRTSWIQVAKSLPTRDYLDGNLITRKTVPWYYEAMEDALSDIFAEEEETSNICIIGHSIGGWIARGYLGGLSFSSTAVYKRAQTKVTSFITLGTPHSSPDTALVDQTRGLLREIEQTAECSSSFLVNERGIQVTNVCSTGVEGRFLSTNVEELVAAASYLPLLGLEARNVKGDGIVPLELGLMEKPANHVVIERSESCGGLVRHASVIPTPWNLLDAYAPSISLPKDFLWYGSKSVLPQWADYIQ